ncbi:MAG: hypothetical protein H0V70_06700 [Ktedonobacteraceae bacterium]|nr:hypothetical protein [Ktedonobacteraceae bacterium]
MTQRVAAARAGIGERTARTYERAGVLPSQRKRLHDWKTREDPFEEDWPWVVSQLERDPALQGSTLFARRERFASGESIITPFRLRLLHTSSFLLWKTVRRCR